MRTSNIDTSRLPTFTNYQDAADYFNRYGKLTFWGWVGRNRQMAVNTFVRKNGVEYFVDIYEDGEVAVRLKNNIQDF